MMRLAVALARALALITHGLSSYARVAGDRSDKGAIAVMNEYVYRPLRTKAAALAGGVTPPPPPPLAAR
jgi:hypothetical protein